MGPLYRGYLVSSHCTVPCLLLFVILLFPRVVLVLMWLFTTYLTRAFHGGLLLPLFGFIFLPITTIVYAWELNNRMPMEGINLLWLLIAVIIDLGGLGGGAHRQSRRNAGGTAVFAFLPSIILTGLLLARRATPGPKRHFSHRHRRVCKNIHAAAELLATVPPSWRRSPGAILN
jgi:hypothetical protein